MCAICVEYQSGRMTNLEAKKALLELIKIEEIDLDHMFEIADLIEPRD